mgnify:CR=1 FL=1
MGKFSISHLVKFGEQKHLYRLLKYGEIYMKNIDFYREYELSNPEHLRGDIYECFNNISQHNTIKFLDSDLEINNVTVYEKNTRENMVGLVLVKSILYNIRQCAMQVLRLKNSYKGVFIMENQGIRDARTLGMPKMLLLGFQHMFAMFGATVLVPVLTGLSVSATLLFASSGSATIAVVPP